MQLAVSRNGIGLRCVKLSVCSASQLWSAWDGADLQHTYAGWWFGTWILWLSIILGMSSSQLTNSYFSEGWLNHQAVPQRCVLSNSFPLCHSQYFNIFGYGSIPINTIFSGMNIHLPAILMFTRGTRFWHTAISTLKISSEHFHWQTYRSNDDVPRDRSTVIVETERWPAPIVSESKTVRPADPWSIWRHP